jgi:hypothetical protein
MRISRYSVVLAARNAATRISAARSIRTCAVHFGPSARSEPEYDVAVVGGGIVGCATARELLTRHPKLKMCLIEKEGKFAAHQSGNNSGVIHAGIYYTPGSLKAKLCVEGEFVHGSCSSRVLSFLIFCR